MQYEYLDNECESRLFSIVKNIYDECISDSEFHEKITSDQFFIELKDHICNNCQILNKNNWDKDLCKNCKKLTSTEYCLNCKIISIQSWKDHFLYRLLRYSLWSKEYHVAALTFHKYYKNIPDEDYDDFVPPPDTPDYHPSFRPIIITNTEEEDSENENPPKILSTTTAVTLTKIIFNSQESTALIHLEDTKRNLSETTSFDTDSEDDCADGCCQKWKKIKPN